MTKPYAEMVEEAVEAVEAEEAVEVVEEAEGDTPLHNHNSRSQQPQTSKRWENSPKSLVETENKQTTSLKQSKDTCDSAKTLRDSTPQ